MALIDKLQRRDAAIRRQYDGVHDDLDAMLMLMIQVVRGEQTADEMGKWISLNYPQYRFLLPKHLQEVPPKA